MRHCPPTFAVLSFLASITPRPAVASPLLGFLYPYSHGDVDRQRPSSSSSASSFDVWTPQQQQPARKRRKQEKRVAPVASENAYSLAIKYAQDNHGTYKHECWELHGHSNCPRDDTNTVTVDHSATTTGGSPTSTQSESPSGTVYTSKFQISNLPQGWKPPDRSPFYSKPAIIGLSVTLAVLIIFTIVGCVIWRVRVAKSRKDIEEVLEEKKRRFANGRLGTDSDDGSDDELPQQPSIRRRRNINSEDDTATLNGTPTDVNPNSGSSAATTQLSKRLQKATKRWKENARLVARRRKVGIPIQASISPSQPEESILADPSTSSTRASQQSADGQQASISDTPEPPASTVRQHSSENTMPNGPIPSSSTSLPPLSPMQTLPVTPPRSPLISTAPTLPDIVIQGTLIPVETARAESPPPSTSEIGLPPAYRRRGFGSSLTVSQQPATRHGKERAVEDSEEEVPDEYLALVASRNRSNLPADPSSLFTPDEERMFSSARLYLDSSGNFEPAVAEDDDDTVATRRMEVTAHVATDDKAALERLRTLGSMPSEPPMEPSDHDHPPTVPEWPEEDAVGSYDEADDSLLSNRLQLQASSAASHFSGIPRLPSPPLQLSNHFSSLPSSSTGIPQLLAISLPSAQTSPSHQNAELPFYVPGVQPSSPPEKGAAPWLMPSAPPEDTSIHGNTPSTSAEILPDIPGPSAPPLLVDPAMEVEQLPSAPSLEAEVDPSEETILTIIDSPQLNNSEDVLQRSLGVPLPRSNTLPLPRYEP